MGSLYAQGKWVPFVTTIEGYPPQFASMLNEQYGFVQTQKGTYRTTDAGLTWVLMGGAPGLWNGIYYYTPANLFVSGSMESTDSGRTWKSLNQPANGPLYILNGIFYDAGGRVSYNHTKTWINFAQVNPFTREFITGNLDKSIAIWGGSGGHFDSTVYSTDGGKTWQIGGSGVESDFGYCIPHSLFYFRAGGDGNDAIQRSLDGGASWQTVYGPIPFRFFSDGIGGDGCVVFAQTMDVATVGGQQVSGVLRSTDFGQSWTCIHGPVSYDDAPLCGVTSRGAVCFAMSFQQGDPLMKFTDSSILHPSSADTKVVRLFPDTLFMTECDSIKIPLQVSFAACDFIRIHDFRIDSLSSQYFRPNFTLNKVISDGETDSSSITLLPNAPGVYNLVAHLNLASSDWTGYDTMMPFVLVIKPNPPVLAIDHNDTLRFGPKPLCLSGGKDTIRLSNPSCNGLKIVDVRFETDSASTYEFSISAISPYTVDRYHLPDKVIINFHPLTPGIKTGKVIIISDIGNDTIPIFANVLPDARTLLIRSDSLVTALCDSIDGKLVFHNLSCRTMILDSLSVPSPYELFGFQPITLLAPGDSLELGVRFTPGKRGPLTLISNAKLKYVLPLSVIDFDTSITLSGFATHGSSAFVLSAPVSHFDTVHLCDSAKERIVLYSIGCDSLPLRSISITGDPDFSYTVLSAQPSAIATGDSVVLEVTLNPTSTGNKSATITLKLQDSSIVNIPLTGSVLRSIRLLYCDKQGTVDFGNQLTCENGDTILTLRNPGCDTVRIAGAGFQGSGFGTTAPFPIVIPPGRSRTIDVQTILDTTGGATRNTSTLTFTSDADTALAPITLSRSYTLPHPVHLRLDADRSPLTSASTWKVKLKAPPNEVTDVRSISFDLNYNSDLLGYLPNVSTAKSADGKSFTISGSPSILLSADSTIAELDFSVYLTTSETTDLAFNNILLNSDPQFTECVAIPQAVGAEFNYLNLCGDPSIRGFMEGKPVQFSIHPNPAQDEITLDLISPATRHLTIEVWNALGARVYSGDQDVASGLNTIRIDMKSLAGGIYEMRVLSGGDVGSMTLMKLH